MAEVPPSNPRLTPDLINKFREKFADEIEKRWELAAENSDASVTIIGGGKIKKTPKFDGAFTRLAQDFLGGRREDVERLREEIFE